MDRTSDRDGRALILSMRGVADLVGYCALYEFEDTVVELMGADLTTPAAQWDVELSRRIYKLTRYATGSRRFAAAVTPRRSVPLSRDYELFLAVFNHPHELFALNAIDAWRRRSRFAACYLCEAWEAQLPVYLLELLEAFDHIFVGVNSSVDAVTRLCGRPVSYLPMGVDTLRFLPPRNARRSIDVCGIGRRSERTHSALLEMARRNGLFYFYDTMQSRPRGKLTQQLTFRVTDAREHRELFANILKRSRYFIANRAWADKPGLTRGVEEIAARFYEGAAAGAILLGEPPETADFQDQFGWADSVIKIPFHAPEISAVIRELDGDAPRRRRIRRDNVVNSLLRHDWVYRLGSVLQVADMPAPEPVVRRLAQLSSLAEETRSSEA